MYARIGNMHWQIRKIFAFYSITTTEKLPNLEVATVKKYHTIRKQSEVGTAVYKLWVC